MPVKKMKGETVKIVQPHGVVESEHSKGVPKEEIVPLDTVVVAEATPTVGLKFGMTKNLGNYESFRVDVSLFLPVKEGESIDATIDFIQNWVNGKMEKILEDIDQ